MNARRLRLLSEHRSDALPHLPPHVAPNPLGIHTGGAEDSVGEAVNVAWGVLEEAKDLVLPETETEFDAQCAEECVTLRTRELSIHGANVLHGFRYRETPE